MSVKKALSVLLILAACCVASLAGGVKSASANSCTPGFWKNHTEIWDTNGPSVTAPYTTSTLIGDVFTGSHYANLTLLDGLSLQGGTGLQGAEEILLRAAIARLLNLAGTQNTAQVQIVITRVNALLAHGTRDQMIAQATRWDTFNNSGGCSTFGG
jgi:hypothetical protein